MIEAAIEAARSAERTGRWDDALRQYEDALRRIRDSEEDASVRAADILRWIGTLHRERGELELAGEVYEASLVIAEAGELGEQTADALNCLAIVEQFEGRAASAEDLYRRARGLAEAHGQERLVAGIDQNLGTLANIRGDLRAAVERYRSALERFHALGDDLSAAWCLNNLGMAQTDAGEWGSAEESFDRAFSLADGVQHLGTLGSIEINRSDLYLHRRDFTSAREHCDRAFEVFGRLESKTGLGEAHKLYGSLHRQMDKLYLAEMHLLLALEMARTSRDRLLEAEAEQERALLATAQGNDREALECLSRARALFGDLEASREVLDIDRRKSRLEESYLQIVTRWSRSIDALDPETAGHAARVADLARRLGEALGVEERELTALRVGALLHDLGKTTIPPAVLKKPGPLDPDEWRMMRDHPVTGARMVAEKGLPCDVGPIVRGHHEHWDGSGYPDGLRGAEIPLGARILRIADAFDTLASPRIYRPPLSPREALRIMEREAGQVHDPDLFAVFRHVVMEE